LAQSGEAQPSNNPSRACKEADRSDPSHHLKDLVSSGSRRSSAIEQAARTIAASPPTIPSASR
jgi:hypothetical protein